MRTVRSLRAIRPSLKGAFLVGRGRAGQARRLNESRPRRRAFATVTAIALIGLTAMAVVAITAELVTDARRSRTAEIDTQLRQLLLAGADEAGRHLTKWDSAPAEVRAGKELPIPLPSTLASDGSLKLTLTPTDSSAAAADPQAVEIRVDAVWCGRRAAETLRYRRTNGTWTLEEVRRV